MWKIFITAGLICAATPAIAGEYVNGYFRSDGTYVQPHFRSSNDGNVWNNYSTQGNVNPYTGRAGKVNPYANQYRSRRSNRGVNNLGPRF